MNFAKFVSMLERGRLYFCRLCRLDDPDEGRIPDRTPERVAQRFPEAPDGMAEKISGMLGAMESFGRRRYYVNCWAMEDNESAAMWKYYCGGGHGVAVRSTFGRLCRSFEPTEHTVYIGVVAYGPEPNGQSTFDFAQRKMPWWAWENELRALVCPVDMLRSGDSSIERGIEVETDLNELIEIVVTDPEAPWWFPDLVRSVLKQYGREKPVELSVITRTPHPNY